MKRKIMYNTNVPEILKKGQKLNFYLIPNNCSLTTKIGQLFYNFYIQFTPLNRATV